MSYNKCLFEGRVTRDIDLKYTSGSEPFAVAKFTIAVERPKKKGQEKADVDYIPITCFGKIAENCERMIGKGNRVLVEAKVQVDNKEDDYGNKRTYYNFIANSVVFIDFKQKNDVRSDNNARDPQQDDIPDSFQQIVGEVPF